jgi:hypothetical protein
MYGEIPPEYIKSTTQNIPTVNTGSAANTECAYLMN